MNDIVLGLIVGFGTGFAAMVAGIVIKKWKQCRSDDIDPSERNNQISFGMNLFSK